MRSSSWMSPSSGRVHMPALGTVLLNPPSPQHPVRVERSNVSAGATGPTITAVLQLGPLAGRRIEVDVVEGRPPKTIDLTADDESRCRYCLAEWVQAGASAAYTFLYLV